ncbi:MAG: hypothetical protein IH874_03990 [Candidatus Dadabacteria bacterium]|nr:hypothetical protein [Candidatus Dadabacteria bacterium]
MPERTDVHIDTPLTNLSVKYSNDELIWRSVMPIVRVRKPSDKYFEYTKADVYSIVDDAVGPKSMPNEVDWDLGTKTFTVTDHALADWVPQEVVDASDNPVSPLVDTNDFLNERLDLAQEDRVAALVFLAATYPSGNKVTLSGTSQWSGSADDPVSDVLTAVETCFMRANTLVFGEEAWKVFRILPEVLDAVKSSTRFQGSQGGLASSSEVASLFDVNRVLIGRARKNTADEGQTPAYARIWGKHMVALHVNPSPGIKGITFGVSFVETDRTTYRDFDGKMGVKGAHYIKVGWNSDEKIIASDLGYMIEDAVA